MMDKSGPLKFIFLLGLVSLLADITYEGARSIIGPFLGSLGATAFWISFTAGAGELVGYGLRLLSGTISDRTRRYWTLTIVGYAVNLLAVPALALAGRWEIAAGLVVMERLGKAIRTPARDVLLSHAAKQVGRGWGFGIHEALDQIGAVAGPLVIGFTLYLKGDYRYSLALLLIPALAALSVLIVAKFLYPAPQKMEETSFSVSSTQFPSVYWLYLMAIGLIAFGYIDFPLIAYHMDQRLGLSKDAIPLLYALAMAIDALAALLFGYLYDRIGFRLLPIAFAASAFFAPFIFLGGSSLAVLGVVLWGVGLGAQESIMRAAVADMVPLKKRGTGYGIFQAGYGLSWFAGSAVMGLLYHLSLLSLALFSVLSLLSALPFFVSVHLRMKANNKRHD